MSKVALVYLDNYEIENVYNALKKGIDLVGGIEKFVNKDEKILIKPNLLKPRSPEYAVTTHPSVFEAMVKILKENDYKNISYGDSPGKGSTISVAKESGLYDIGEKYNIELKDFSQGNTVHNPENDFAKQFEIANAVTESDSIISISKMKTHQLTRITGAIKNIFGCVNGFNKGASHVKFSDGESFSKMLIDLVKTIKPKLNIMDGVVAMEGNGPGSGTPTKMNVLLISEDPIALDIIFAKMVNLDRNYLPFIEYSRKINYGTKEEDIEIVGDDLDKFINKEFDVVREPVGIGKFDKYKRFRRFLLKKPYVIQKRCIKCKICVNACPLSDKAISFNEKENRISYDYSKCIRCYCCQEMCQSKAIEVKTPILNKILIR